MSAQFMRATGQAPPIQPSKAFDATTAPLSNTTKVSPMIEQKIDAFRSKHGINANWWWREPCGTFLGLSDQGRYLFLRIFNDAAYFYELAARENDERGFPPDYAIGKPFNELTFDDAWSIWGKVERQNRSGLHFAPLEFAPELSKSLPGVQVLLQLDLAAYSDSQLTSQFKRNLDQLRAECGIPEPASPARTSNRILNSGRSFLPLEALDVHRLSQDAPLKNFYADQLTDAKQDRKSMSEELFRFLLETKNRRKA